MHFTQISSSWLNLVERWLADPTTLQRGSQALRLGQTAEQILHLIATYSDQINEITTLGGLVSGDPALYIVTCGGRPAGDLATYVEQIRADGWDTCVIATPAARQFMRADRLAEASGHVVRYEYKQPDEPDVLPPPDAAIVAPATFNTINKWAAGISDTLALGLLNEAVGTGLPIIAVPFPSVALARHPAFRSNIETLRSWGIRMIFDPERHPLPTPNMGPPAAELFPWRALMTELVHVRRELTTVQESRGSPGQPETTPSG